MFHLINSLTPICVILDISYPYLTSAWLAEQIQYKAVHGQALRTVEEPAEFLIVVSTLLSSSITV